MGDSAPFTYTINVGSSYTNPKVFDITANPTDTEEQIMAFMSLCGSPECTLSNGNLTIKIYGEKPNIDIPILIVVRG